MKSKHTPGQWMASSTEIVAMPSQVKISNRISGSTYEEAKANAQLIATAPEMLETLKDIKSALIDSGFLKESNTVIIGMQLVIDKATTV